MKNWIEATVCVAACAALVACHHAIAPKISYPLSPTVLLPLESTVRDASNNFGATFCSVFSEFQANETHGCYHYFQDSAPKQQPPQVSLVSDVQLQRYRYVLVNGFMSGCFQGSSFQVFGDTDTHLATHGVKLERVVLQGMDSPEADAQQILNYLQTPQSLSDPKPIILIGYSKGATDLQAAILRIQQESPELNSKVRALITVAGMIGGSRIYDLLEQPESIAALFGHFPFFGCPVGKRDFRSMSRQGRQHFLRDHWRSLAETPTYSLTTVSDRQSTSFVLKPLWEQLSVYSIDQDSQMAQAEQIAPGGTFLGTARADHWAVAVPLETDPILNKLVDKNHYPRAAMLEALLRFVVADLDHKISR